VKVKEGILQVMLDSQYSGRNFFFGVGVGGFSSAVLKSQLLLSDSCKETRYIMCTPASFCYFVQHIWNQQELFCDFCRAVNLHSTIAIITVTYENIHCVSLHFNLELLYMALLNWSLWTSRCLV
jgi:hypothetical protein